MVAVFSVLTVIRFSLGKATGLMRCYPSLWKVFAVCPVFKNVGKHSSQSQYQSINLLSIISKFFESIINKNLNKKQPPE